MSYKYTVEDFLEKIANEIWESAKSNDHEAFVLHIKRLKLLKLTAVARSEYAKVALGGLCAWHKIDIDSPKHLAKQAFVIADAMIEAENAK